MTVAGWYSPPAGRVNVVGEDACRREGGCGCRSSGRDDDDPFEAVAHLFED
jgi:hypothetical protein